MTALAIAYDKDLIMNLQSLPPRRVIIFVKMPIPALALFLVL